MNTAQEKVSTDIPADWLGAAELGCSAQSWAAVLPVCPEGGLRVLPEALLRALDSSSSVAFLQWVHFLDAKHLYLLVLPFERCLWLVCFELHYRLESNCESLFILLGVAANHSDMLQRIYNCSILYVYVFNCIWVFMEENKHDFKSIIMLHVTSLQFILLLRLSSH